MSKTLLYSISCCLLLTACVEKAPEQQTLFQSLPASKTEIQFSNRITENDTFNILTYEYVYNGGGVGIADFNQDGLPDVYFTGNMVGNQMYLNKGDFKFEDITDAAGVDGHGRWNSGVAVVDINNDGWPDLYVCATTYTPESRRRNLLYVNQGLNENKIPVFKELAAEYGIDDDSYTTHAAFFDYDNDGDLDLFLAVNQMDGKHVPNFYRKKITNGSSIRRDRLYRNDFDAAKGHAVYTDVSIEAGILVEGFSLGLNITDINGDDWKDIYLTNDYLTNDLLYINNGDGTFTDRAADYLKHTSYSAMGNDVIDLNNDGLSDIVALDMLPEDNFRRKTMLPPNNYTGYINNQKFDYQFQYVRNTLQLNQGPRPDNQEPLFSEIGLLSNISGTDWSWTPLVADFDHDGLRDLIVTNGFPKDVTDRDFIDYNADQGFYVTKEHLLKKIPSVKINNYAFKNTSKDGIPVFEDVGEAWGIHEPSFSNGAAYADLDLDGDLDYVVNNINDSAYVFKNNLIEQSTPASSNWLKVQLEGAAHNKNGLGATVHIYYENGQQQVYENTPYRGYLSSVEGGAHFGLGKVSKLDSVVIDWPLGQQQVLKAVSANQILKVQEAEANEAHSIAALTASPVFKNITAQVGIDFIHEERDYIDFNVQRLLPHKLSQYGPGIAIADVNGDDLDDFYVSGSHFRSGYFFIQRPNGQFDKTELLESPKSTESKGEELGSLFFDADQDGDLDLYLVHGGYEFDQSDSCYQDKLYFNENGRFVLAANALPTFLSSGSCVKAADYDRDGDLDLFVGGRVLPNLYPKPVSSYLLQNDGTGKFSIVNDQVATSLNDLGMVCDALWTDFDNDGWQDLLIAGEWMPLQFLKNEDGQLKPYAGFEEAPENLSGWWNSLTAADFDLDGDMDYIAGNLGINTLFRADEKRHIAIYGADFDKNGGFDAIPTAFFPDQKGTPTEFPYFNRIDVEKQTISVKGTFIYHADFGKATMSDVLESYPVKDRLSLSAKKLETSYIENLGNGRFAVRALPIQAQLAPVYGMVTGDFNGDALPDVLLSGNDYGLEVGTGRYDALNGLLLLGDGKGHFSPQVMQQSGLLIPGDAKCLASIQSADGRQLIIAGQNQGPLLVFQKNDSSGTWVDLKPFDCAANIQMEDGKSYREELPYGHSFLSQSSRKLWLPQGVNACEIIDYLGNKRKVSVPKWNNPETQQAG